MLTDFIIFTQLKLNMKYYSEKSLKLFHRQTFFHSAVETCVLLVGIRAPWMIRKKLWQAARDLSEGVSKEAVDIQLRRVVRETSFRGCGGQVNTWFSQPGNLCPWQMKDHVEQKGVCEWGEKSGNKRPAEEMDEIQLSHLQSRGVLVPPHWIMGIQDNADDKSKKGSWGGKMMDSGIHHSPRGQFLTTELPSVLFKDCSVIYFNQ